MKKIQLSKYLSEINPPRIDLKRDFENILSFSMECVKSFKFAYILNEIVDFNSSLTKTDIKRKKEEKKKTKTVNFS